MGVVRALVYTNLWIAAGAMSLFWAGYHLLGGEGVPLRTLTFLGCATLITYNMHWLLAGRGYCAGRADEKYQWYARFYPWGWGLFALAVVGEVWGVLGLSLREWMFFAHLGVIAMLYNLPEQRTPQWLVSIRRIPFLKIFLIAYLWAAIGAGYPALILDAFSPAVLFWFVGLLLYVFSITLPFDIRDMGDDRDHGLLTLPQRWGVPATKWVAIVCLVVSGVVFVFGGLNPWVAALLVVPGVGAVVATTTRRHELYFTGLIDSLLVVFGPVVVYLS